MHHVSLRPGTNQARCEVLVRTQLKPPSSDDDDADASIDLRVRDSDTGVKGSMSPVGRFSAVPTTMFLYVSSSSSHSNGESDMALSLDSMVR